MLNTLNLNGTWKVRWSDGTRGRPEFANQEVIDPGRYIDAPRELPKIRVEEAERVRRVRDATFAWGVCIDLGGEQALPDNFFDL